MADPKTLSWTVSVQVSGGPSISVSRESQPVEAYDYVQLAVEPGAADRTVEIQPGAADRLTMLLVQSSYYGTDLKVSASDGTDNSDPIVLNEPQVLAGGAIALLGVDPKILKFTNGSADQTAMIDIYVFRDATP